MSLPCSNHTSPCRWGWLTADHIAVDYVWPSPMNHRDSLWYLRRWRGEQVSDRTNDVHWVISSHERELSNLNDQLRENDSYETHHHLNVPFPPLAATAIVSPGLNSCSFTIVSCISRSKASKKHILQYGSLVFGRTSAAGRSPRHETHIVLGIESTAWFRSIETKLHDTKKCDWMRFQNQIR